MTEVTLRTKDYCNSVVFQAKIARWILGLCLVLVLLLCAGEAQAGQLAERMAQFPNWENKPPVTVTTADLVYPGWMEGTWKVTSTLVEQVAPLAPDVITPGFESNRRYLNQPVSFLVRFQAASNQASSNPLLPLNTRNSKLKIQNSKLLRGASPSLEKVPNSDVLKIPVVADRAFNGLNIAKAYLGEARVQSVKVDPDTPNRQITSLNTGRQLVSVVTSRASELPTLNQFIATEVSNQVFRGTSQPYFNQVETTTAYHLLTSPSQVVEANQVTAIYLSPQDADYFKALTHPVALYRYHLKLLPMPELP